MYLPALELNDFDFALTTKRPPCLRVRGTHGGGPTVRSRGAVPSTAVGVAPRAASRRAGRKCTHARVHEASCPAASVLLARGARVAGYSEQPRDRCRVH